MDQTQKVHEENLSLANHTTMPSGTLNIKKMIQKKKRPTKLPELKQSTFILPPKTVEERKQAELLKKEKIAQKRIDDIKRYKRSIKRIWLAKHIETIRGIPFLEICDGMESKNSQILKIVKTTKQELVDAKFRVKEEEEGEEE